MTTYDRNKRQHMRYRLRRWQRAINALLTLAIALAILVATHAPAAAAPRCPGGTATPHGCHYVWSGLDCYWQPGRLAVCIAPLEAQP